MVFLYSKERFTVSQLEKEQRAMLFKLEEQTSVPYLLMKKLLQVAEKNSTSEMSQKERISEYHALIKKYMGNEEN